MSFTVDVVFGGMCAFTPETHGDRAWVLMPDWRTVGMKGTPEHRAVIAFDLADVDGLDARNAGSWVILELVQEHVEILRPNGVGATPPLNIHGFEYLNQTPEVGATDLGSLAWLASLGAASRQLGLKEAGTVAAELLDPRVPSPWVDRLAARFLLSSGQLRTETLSNQSGNLIEWRFQPASSPAGNNGLRQVLAGEVTWSQQIDTAWVELRTTDLRDGAVRRSIRLRPGDGEQVRIYALNEEADAIMEMDPDRRPPVRLGDIRQQDRVFEAFYELSKSPPPPGQRPIPVAAAFVADAYHPLGGPSHHSPPCSPVRMEVGS